MAELIYKEEGFILAQGFSTWLPGEKHVATGFAHLLAAGIQKREKGLQAGWSHL